MSARPEQGIAVIGMSARYPGARNVREFWDNLVHGRDSVEEVPRHRWDHDRWYDPAPDAPNKTYSRWGGFIEGVDRFDPLFFNISPLEAEWMDPQHRLVLEETWKALEDAGQAVGRLDGTRCSVFVGCKEAEYVTSMRGVELNPFTLSGGSMAILPARISYFLNLKGASVPIDTACSSSLVAVHLACESLRSGACDMAIAGGVALMMGPRTHLVLGKAGLLSPGGRCRTFDDSADGIALGEGVGVVVLKSLERALADGDFIHGVIKASGLNQDGRTNGITAPSGPSQTALECEVYDRAGIHPETLGYVEAHGTGTRLGDPLEVQALTDAFRRYTDRRGFCALGAVKTNIGHTLEASGIAGLIKVLLCLQHGMLVPSLHFKRVNRHLDLENSPFFVNTETRPWTTRGGSRRAALSAFGFSGTNAHMVLEEAPAVPRRTSGTRRPFSLFPLSAKTEGALRQRMVDLRGWLGTHGRDASLEDVAFTLQVGRTHLPVRAAFIARDAEHLAGLLDAAVRGERPSGVFFQADGQASTSARRDAALLGLGNSLLRELRALDGGAEAHARRLAVVAGLHVKGYDLDWQVAHGPEARRIPLPTYPFAGERYWLQAADPAGLVAPASDEAGATLPRQELQRATSPEPQHEALSAASSEPKPELLVRLQHMVTELLKLPVGTLQPDDGLMAFGFNSLIGARLLRRLEESDGIRLPHSALLEAETLRELATRVAAELGARASTAGTVRPFGNPESGTRPSAVDTVSSAEAGTALRESLSAPRAPSGETLPIMPSRFPLSAGQLGLWLIHQLAPDATAYHVPCAFELRGDVAVPDLEAALRRLWARHPSLRARIVVEDGQPVQVIEPAPSLPLQVHTLPESGNVESFLAPLIAAPFDLARGPLARVHLVVRQGQAPLLLLVAHHLVLDGSSVQLLVRDLEALYEAERAGGEAVPSRQTASYADFVAWQSRMLGSGEGQRHRDYWRNRLLPEPVALNLPTDRPRPPKRRFHGRTVAVTLPMELAQDVRQLGSTSRLFPFTLYLAAFKALLHRYTQQEDVLVGIPVMGRPRVEFEDVVGYFVNVVCLRSHVSAEASFLDFARTLQSLHFEALEHADFPFTEVVRELGGARNRGHGPLVQVQFVYQNWISPETGRARGTLKLEPLLDFQQQGEFDLSLELVELDGRAHLFFKYDPDLFDAVTMERMASHYEALLRSAVRTPSRRLGTLDCLGPVERYQLETEWRRTERPFPREHCVHELFEEQVRKTPDALAVTSAGQTLSYAELNARANQLATTLRAAGVGPDSIVAVLAERSLELIVGLFGILKAGGAYLPIDPRYPAERIQYMLEDSRAQVLLVTDRQWVPAAFQGRVVDLKDAGSYAGDGANLARRAGPTSLAYVIYTSGSTGRPKGAMLEHRGLINRLKWMQNRYPIGVGDVILQKTPYTFDVSVWELFWWALQGARVSMLPPGVEKDPRALVDAIARDGVTVMHFVPSALSVFLEYVKALRDVRELASLRQVFASGEALTVSQVARFNELRLGAKLANLYGPTEASIDVSYFDCSEQEQHDRIPIGRPIENIQLFVLSRDLVPQPIGVPGELFIAGVGLARGYLNNPTLTAERFIAHPFVPGERMYRTGDLARWLPDGNLEYLGRVDRQVKVRGLRIELGEVEAALTAVPGVQDAFVIALPAEGGSGNDRLAAYWVGTREYTPEALRQLLGRTLPDFMVPSAFVRLPSLPQTAHGKVDTRALPRPEQDGTGTAADRLEVPRPGLEESIATLLQELSGGRRIGRRENFFDSGHHSLLLARCAIRLSALLGREVPVVALFEHPTVEALARHLSTNGGEAEARADKQDALSRSLKRGQQQRARLARLAVRPESAPVDAGVIENGVGQGPALRPDSKR
uniref:Polyketide synthase non-ribosomal peptide synthetase hybrid n=1 Tax=Pyxidicoccus sp. MCy9557 TaxID=2012863 RepID=A0A1Z2TJL5_9BACT|nr:polyketide synthase non-ribosomal peptide synthetase hybrid [Pyxidicoccus sp. MCy9557]